MQLLTARHPHELTASNHTVLTLSDRVLGLGGASCGPIPLERDIVRSGSYQFGYTLFPIRKGEDAGVLARRGVSITSPVVIERDRRSRVFLNSATLGAKIRYRLQGGEWQLWKSPFVLKQAGNVEAIAEAPGKLSSAVSAREFPYALPRDGFRILGADSEQPDEGEASHAIDGKPDTYWHTRWQGQAPRPPHEIAIDLGVKAELAGITVLPRQDQENGRIGNYQVFTSVDGQAWGEPAAKGRFSGGQGLEKVLFSKPLGARYIKLVALTEINNNAWTAVAEIDAIALRLMEPPQARDDWSIDKVTSEQPGEGEADHLIDGKPGTFWHTQYGLFLAKHPHEVTVDLGRSVRLAGMTVLPRQDSRNGRIKGYRVTISSDGEAWSEPIATGELADEATLQKIAFRQAVAARFVKFSALSAHDGDDFAAAAEFDFIISP